MMRLLLLLAESPGTVVGADRMLREIWPGVVVSSSSVYQAISQLRRMLEDSEGDQTCIATVPRKGYRLVAPVGPLEVAAIPAAIPAAVPTVISAKADTADNQPIERVLPSPTPTVGGVIPASPPVAVTPERRRRLAVAILLVALLLAGAGWFIAHTWFARPVPAAMAEVTPAIVVLPFSDMTQEGHDQFFCDGLTEELSNWLAQIPSLRVVARTSAFAFRGQQDAREIGRQLNITHVVEGSMRRYGDHMRITVQLIDARSGFHLWSSEYDRRPEDTLTLQEDVARAVAESLQIQLTEDTTARFAERRSASAQAYNLYLLALHYQGARTREANKQAIDLYHQVLTADPKFTLAYVGLAFATLNQRYLNGRPVTETTATAEPLLQEAERLDPQLSELYATRGALREDQNRIEDAESDLRRAVILNPNDARAHAELGRLMLIMARPREALDSLSRGAALDPLDFTLHSRRCVALQDMTRYTEAVVACAQARELQGTANFGFIASSWLEWTQGHLPEALQWNADAQRQAPGDTNLYERRADLLLTLGLPHASRQTLEQARVATRDDDRINLDLSQIVFYEDGADALRAYLATLHPENLRSARRLIQLAHFYLLANQPQAAEQSLVNARNAPDFNLAELNDPWYARWGESEELVIALCESQTGQPEAADKHAREVLAMLDLAIANGEQRHGIYLLKAQALAMMGEKNAAMVALTRAADLGWRQSWWADHEPWFTGLRSRADFRALLARVDSTVRQQRDHTQLAD